MGLLQRWLDEPDERIARFAKAFYVLTVFFMAIFTWLTVSFLLGDDPSAERLVGPLVSALLTLVMYNLAIDGRRSYKAMKLRREAPAPVDPKA